MKAYIHLHDNLDSLNKGNKSEGITEMIYDKAPEVGETIRITIPTYISDQKHNHWYRKLDTDNWTIHSCDEIDGDLIIEAYYTGEKKLNMWKLKSSK
jgi:hypothetical protein